MHLLTPTRGRQRERNTATETGASTARRIACPTCGEAKGFLLELEGAAYRVLEDENDTDLLPESGPAFVTCGACKTTYDAQELLERQEVELAEEVLRAVPIRMGPRRNRVHRVGKAATRTTADGRTLPMCPACGATHEFFIDLEGAAYRVLEDDQDTDLLGEAANLLCSRCHAVFEV